MRSKKIDSTILLRRIRELILAARQTVARSVDTIQVLTCFEIGHRIIEHEQQGEKRAEYGKAVLKQLSVTLTKEFGRGFSEDNLSNMRKFYLIYGSLTNISETPSRKLSVSRKSETPSDKSPLAVSAKTPVIPFPLSWSHYVFLIGVKRTEERRFYEIEAASQNWSLRELKRQFDSGLFERLAASRNTTGIGKLARHGQQIADPKDVLKEPYILEFLGLDERAAYSETDLESAIIDKLGKFLRELGKGFLFEARQRRFTFDEDHFFVDLVFYNRLLRCYVLIDLKIGKLTHQDLGQMQMYVNYYDRHIKTDDEKPTVGIILCKKKHDALVEITLPKGANIFAKQYQLYLPSKEELKQKLLDWTEQKEGDQR
ncbi:MAG: PDDEXK nuclease domain-containing protein [Ignavibacteriales bacterium]|nr:PDDEXK nuclease domain-containing protein [Ignavibacteriales bacterium]